MGSPRERNLPHHPRCKPRSQDCPEGRHLDNLTHEALNPSQPSPGLGTLERRLAKATFNGESGPPQVFEDGLYVLGLPDFKDQIPRAPIIEHLAEQTKAIDFGAGGSVEQTLQVSPVSTATSPSAPDMQAMDAVADRLERLEQVQTIAAHQVFCAPLLGEHLREVES